MQGFEKDLSGARQYLSAPVASEGKTAKDLSKKCVLQMYCYKSFVIT